MTAPNMTAPNMTAPQDLTAVEAAGAIARRELTSVDLVKACLARIEARETDVKAFAFLDAEQALAQARAADDAATHGRGTGPLHGVPVAIKDIIDTADMPTECGTPVFKGRRPEEDAACVAALRRAGAIILGKTITTELATLTPNVTANPRNLGHTPGGSSSGSAAAVADHMAPLALGTQTGGSVIRPGSFCGIYGFKPTYGLIPRTGVLDQSKTLDTIGVYGRSIADVALAADVLAVHDPRDAASINVGQASLLATASMPWQLKPMFAFVKTSAWDEFADPVTKEAFGELVDMLGDQVHEISFDETTRAGLAAHRIVNDAELAQQFGPLLDKAPELISKRLAAQIEQGRAIKASDYLNALAARETAYRGCRELFTNYGAILTPAAPGPAPKTLAATGNAIFNAFWTFMGTPAITVPLLEADGLPIGVQLVAARRDDGRLLRSARLLVDQLNTAA
jgi:Asp-tRNA(Asn)/Glu-tRNA(Gln) amidotransferase A subunit family amidase